MIHTVLWTPAAEQELATAWLDAADRGEVTRAANSIDRLLRVDPETRGESRYDAVRILFMPPLGVDFEVRADDCMVYVLSTWLISRTK